MIRSHKWRFVLLYGVLLWGYPTGLITRTITLFPPSLHRPTFTSLADVILSFVLWTLGGIAFGLVMWRARRNQASDPSSDAEA